MKRPTTEEHQVKHKRTFLNADGETVTERTWSDLNETSYVLALEKYIDYLEGDQAVKEERERDIEVKTAKEWCEELGANPELQIIKHNVDDYTTLETFVYNLINRICT